MKKEPFTKTYLPFLFSGAANSEVCGGESDRTEFRSEGGNHPRTIERSKLQLLEVSAKSKQSKLISWASNRPKTKRQLFAESRTDPPKFNSMEHKE